MNWNITIGGESHSVFFPEGTRANAPFRAKVGDLAYECTYNENRGTLSLRPITASGGSASEIQIHLRRNDVLRTEGEVDRTVHVEMSGGGFKQTRSIKAIARPFIPGIAATTKSTSQKAMILRSPMAGKVLKILHTAGAKVEAGEPVVIIEAMKMENKLLAPAAVTISAVKVQEGAAVIVGQELMKFS